MAVACHAQDEKGLDVDDAGCGKDIVCLDDAIDGVPNGIEDLLRHLAPRSSDQAHGVKKDGRRVRSCQELGLREDGKHGSNVGKVSVDQ